jgi:hypothetical protein
MSSDAFWRIRYRSYASSRTVSNERRAIGLADHRTGKLVGNRNRLTAGNPLAANQQLRPLGDRFTSL